MSSDLPPTWRSPNHLNRTISIGRSLLVHSVGLQGLSKGPSTGPPEDTSAIELLYFGPRGDDPLVRASGDPPPGLRSGSESSPAPSPEPRERSCPCLCPCFASCLAKLKAGAVAYPRRACSWAKELFCACVTCVRQQRRRQRRRQKQHQTSPLLDFPLEVLFNILSHLDMRDVVSLRQTCKGLEAALNFDNTMSIFLPRIDDIVNSMCCRCLRQFPGSELFALTLERAVWPVRNTCMTCAGRARDCHFEVGHRYRLKSRDVAAVCGWCRGPLAAETHPELRPFHKACKLPHLCAVVIFAVCQALHAVVHLSACVCAFVFFGSSPPFILTIALCLYWGIFSEVIICVRLLTIRHQYYRTLNLRTYHWSFCLDLFILIHQVPLFGQVLLSSSAIPEPKWAFIPATEYIFGICIAMRVATFIGHFILFLDRPFWCENRSASRFRLLPNLIATGLALLINPYIFELNYPGTTSWKNFDALICFSNWPMTPPAHRSRVLEADALQRPQSALQQAYQAQQQALQQARLEDIEADVDEMTQAVNVAPGQVIELEAVEIVG